MNASFYEQQSLNYIRGTINLCMKVHIWPFMSRIKKKGGNKILDIGCGSGRDLRTFTEEGFNAAGIEPDEFFSEYSSLYSGAPVAHCKIENFKSNERFDGVWCNASLVHIERKHLKRTLMKIHSLMNSEAELYISVKHGKDFFDGSRHFTCLTDETAKELFQDLPFSITNTYQSLGNGAIWLNITATAR